MTPVKRTNIEATLFGCPRSSRNRRAISVWCIRLDQTSTPSTKIESIDRTLTDLFDGHKDARMARFYVDGDKVDYDRLFAALDYAINELE